MCENNDEDVSELEIQTQTWNKIEKNMKLIGFREGAAKGRDQSLQEGFDVGYAAGFNLGEKIGQIKGILSCPKELTFGEDFKHSEENIESISENACVMCLKGKNSAEENKNESYPDINEIISQQEKLSSDIIDSLRNSKLGSYLEKT